MESLARIELIGDKQRETSAYASRLVMSSGNDPLWIVFIVKDEFTIIMIRSYGTRKSIGYAGECGEPQASHRRVKMLIFRMTRFVDRVRVHCFGQARCTR